MDDLRRDYLSEAYAILKGTTRLLPQREHLVALIKEHQRQNLAALSVRCDNGSHKEVP